MVKSGKEEVDRKWKGGWWRVRRRRLVVEGGKRYGVWKVGEGGRVEGCVNVRECEVGRG